MADPTTTVTRTRNPYIGSWLNFPGAPRFRGGKDWYVMFPNTPGAYHPCNSWHEALDIVARWYAMRTPEEG